MLPRSKISTRRSTSAPAIYLDALKWRGIAFEKTGETDRAVRDYEAALKLNPSDEWLAKSVRVLREL